MWVAATAGSLCAACSLRDKASLASPVNTHTFHGWVLVPDAERDATRSMSSITSRATGVGKKARTEAREVMAASTVAAAAAVDDSEMRADIGSFPASSISQAALFHSTAAFFLNIANSLASFNVLKWTATVSLMSLP